MPTPRSTSTFNALPEEVRNLLAGKEREGGGVGAEGRRAGGDTRARRRRSLPALLPQVLGTTGAGPESEWRSPGVGLEAGSGHGGEAHLDALGV